jgi:hypothetical protein
LACQLQAHATYSWTVSVLITSQILRIQPIDFYVGHAQLKIRKLTYQFTENRTATWEHSRCSFPVVSSVLPNLRQGSGMEGSYTPEVSYAHFVKSGSELGGSSSSESKGKNPTGISAALIYSASYSVGENSSFSSTRTRENS